MTSACLNRLGTTCYQSRPWEAAHKALRSPCHWLRTASRARAAAPSSTPALLTTGPNRAPSSVAPASPARHRSLSSAASTEWYLDTWTSPADGAFTGPRGPVLSSQTKFGSSCSLHILPEVASSPNKPQAQGAGHAPAMLLRVLPQSRRRAATVSSSCGSCFLI